MTTSTPPTEILRSLVSGGFDAKRLDQLHDLLKLMGIVLGQIALLEVVTSPKSEDAAKVSAARALTKLDEDPAVISERLRSSVLSGLSVAELEAMIGRIKSGETDLQKLVAPKLK